MTRFSGLLTLLFLAACGRQDGLPSARSVGSTPLPILVPDWRFHFAGDYVQPRFSPDARYLAFSEVVRTEDGESTRLLILHLGSGRLDTLLAPDSTRSYGVYSSFVLDIEWPTIDIVRFTLSDGDVGATMLDFSLHSLDIVATSYSEDDDLGMKDLPESLATIARKLAALYPRYLRRAIEGALWNQPLLLGDSAVVLQFSYVNTTHNVIRLSLKAPLETTLVVLDSGRAGIAAFGGGVATASAFAFAARTDSTAVIYSGSSSGVTPVIRVPVSVQQPVFQSRYRSSRRAIGIVRTGHSYERAENVAIVVDSNGVRPLPAPMSLYDLDVDRSGSLVAIAHWVGDQRHLGVAPLVINR